MATLTQTTKQRKPRKAQQPIHGVARWIGSTATQGQLDGGDVVLKIVADGKEAQFYFVETVKDGDKITGYRLVKIDSFDQTATYDVEITPHGFRCDCPDATYSDRPGGCKHAVGLKAALAVVSSK
jgi:hypothetical protein